MWIFKLFNKSAERLFICFQSIKPNFLGSRPIKIFSATVKLGHKFTSWYTVEIPHSCASFGLFGEISLPFKVIVPPSRW